MRFAMCPAWRTAKYLTAADAHQRRQPFAVRLHGAHGKEYICRVFLFLPRALLRLTANSYPLSCAPCLAHGEDVLCREFLVCREPGLWLSAKSYLCRVPDGMHTAKSPAHGIARDSVSDWFTLHFCGSTLCAIHWGMLVCADQSAWMVWKTKRKEEIVAITDKETTVITTNALPLLIFLEKLIRKQWIHHVSLKNISNVVCHCVVW